MTLVCKYRRVDLTGTVSREKGPRDFCLADGRVGIRLYVVLLVGERVEDIYVNMCCCRLVLVYVDI